MTLMQFLKNNIKNIKINSSDYSEESQNNSSLSHNPIKLEITSTKNYDVLSIKNNKNIKYNVKMCGNVGTRVFKVVSTFSLKNNKIKNVHILDINLLESSSTSNSCYYYYYDYDNSNTENTNDLEKNIFKGIKDLLTNAFVNIGPSANITFTLNSQYNIENLVLKFTKCKTLEASQSHVSEKSNNMSNSAESCNSNKSIKIKKNMSNSAESCNSNKSTKIKKNNSLDLSSSNSSLSNSPKSNSKNNYIAKIVKLIAWGSIIAFVVFILSKKYKFNKPKSILNKLEKKSLEDIES